MRLPLGIEITAGILSSVAFASSVYRITIRLKGPGLWFDDAWAIFATVALIVYTTAIYLPVPNPPGTIGVARYYMLAVGFYMVIWPSRLSILCSLIRLEHHTTWKRVWKGFGVVFVIFWVGLLVQLFLECESDTAWKQLESPQCHLQKDVAIAQLVTDIFADCMLLYIPMRLFRCIMSRPLRKRLMLIFSTCIMTTIVSLVHASFILISGGPREIVAAVVEVFVSILVCNLPLCIAHIFRQGKWFEDEDPITTSMWPSWLRNSLTNPGTGTTRPQLNTPTNSDRPIVSVSLPQVSHDPESCDTESHSLEDFSSRSGNKIRC